MGSSIICHTGVLSHCGQLPGACWPGALTLTLANNPVTKIKEREDNNISVSRDQCLWGLRGKEEIADFQALQVDCTNALSLGKALFGRWGVGFLSENIISFL